MKIRPLEIPEVLLIEPQRFGDERGWFSETFREAALAEAGFTRRFVQDNHSFSAPKGTLRGLHFQVDPNAQDKLVRCTRGSIVDVAVDIRQGSPTYGRHVKATLSAENGHQLLVPIGFAHAFVTLEPDCEVQYKVTGYYSKECDRGIFWNDPDLGIEWPFPAEEMTLSEKDKNAPLLADSAPFFVY
ncbi:dTDP-4-dehydrorhamnose 3,5-epimerase [Lutibaculum baratangense]|uniref:dTDP-4-dehydrorhamnose 3,5-epimerase n=1 Tax=Lutibaculum baratangense AMV1 TaxID=631454 RepID=V4RB55_9HYPH|nr:dTDP-4-dehydrorhamnose 3,5-epimerase [Lutibaculum baratangense]ESR22639.1 dTDP-4-dehydrorhamnose 3,5-epimerase [Lutibaculum baratangense AMV1]